MTPADAHLSVDVALGWLAARLLWLVIEQGILRPFAAAFGREAWRHADSALGGRLPDIPHPPR